MKYKLKRLVKQGIARLVGKTTNNIQLTPHEYSLLQGTPNHAYRVRLACGCQIVWHDARFGLRVGKNALCDDHGMTTVAVAMYNIIR